MSSAKKLTEVEQCFFDHNWNVLPLPKLSEKLNRTCKFLEKLIVEKAIAQPVQPVQSAQQPQPELPPPPSAFNRLVGRQKNVDGTTKKNSPVVMTAAASEVADDHLRLGNPGGMSPGLARSVFKMREND